MTSALRHRDGKQFASWDDPKDFFSELYTTLIATAQT
jgi:hypothetical protein